MLALENDVFFLCIFKLSLLMCGLSGERGDDFNVIVKVSEKK
jgi:hypothetical protein